MSLTMPITMSPDLLRTTLVGNVSPLIFLWIHVNSHFSPFIALSISFRAISEDLPWCWYSGDSSHGFLPSMSSSSPPKSSRALLLHSIILKSLIRNIASPAFSKSSRYLEEISFILCSESILLRAPAVLDAISLRKPSSSSSIILGAETTR